MDKFADKVKPWRNTTLRSGNIFKPSLRTDIEVIGIPASIEALHMNNAKVMNMIILGAYLGLKPVVKTNPLLLHWKGFT